MSLRQLSLGLACILAVAFATSAAADVPIWKTYSLGGNARFQIGNGLPIPITFQPAPNGKVLPIAGAVARQTLNQKPAVLQIRPRQLIHRGTLAPLNLPVFLANSAVFQVLTSVNISIPRTELNFRAGGRTGGPTETFCPSSTGGPPYNCAGPGTPGTPINGLLRYVKTTNQFGGPGSGIVGGGADVAIRVASAAPCSYVTKPGCQVIFALATPATNGAVGAPFEFTNSTAGAPAPAPGGRRNAIITTAGHVTFVTSPGLGSGIPNPVVEYGAPWTTGQLKVSVTNNVGPVPEIFTFTGSDARTSSGNGSISLVAGSVSDRGLTGPNANRGWLNLTLSTPGIGLPALSTGGIALLVSLMAGAGLWVVRRRSAI